MSGYVEGSARCEEIRDELAELALGTLSGRERSEVLGHVGSCPRCSAELEQLSVVADALLQLAPSMQPPLGFELTLAARLRSIATPRRRVQHVRLLAVAAAVVVVFAFGLGALLAPQGGSAKGQRGLVG